jgi:hypothetical protein
VEVRRLLNVGGINPAITEARRAMEREVFLGFARCCLWNGIRRSPRLP